MATAVVTPDQDAVVAEIFIAAPPERVFQAITDPTQPPKWWGQPDMYRVTEWKGDLRPGGKWKTSGVGADGTSFEVGGEYVEIDPPHKLVYTWTPSWSAALRTVVTWVLEPQPIHNLQPSGPRKAGTGTLVKIRHTGFAGFPKEAMGHSQGWTRVIGWMQAFIERGETIDTRK